MNSFDLLFSHLEYNVLCRLWVERHDEACVERASDQVSEYRSSQCLFGFGLGLPEMSRFTKVIWKSFLGTIWYFFASQCQALDEVSHIENTNLKNNCLHSLLLSWCKREGRKQQQLILIVGSKANYSISFAIQMTLMLKHYLRPESKL